MYALGESISVFNCIEVQEELLQYVGGTEKCQIDAASLTDIDTAGLQLLISLKKHCDSNGLSMEVINMQESILTLLNKLSLEAILIKENLTYE